LAHRLSNKIFYGIPASVAKKRIAETQSLRFPQPTHALNLVLVIVVEHNFKSAQTTSLLCHADSTQAKRESVFMEAVSNLYDYEFATSRVLTDLPYSNFV
jgi:hypothetical protein